MLWTPKDTYHEEPFELEADLEDAIRTVSADLFGPNRFYVDVKKKIGLKSKIINVPDAYLIDLSSIKKPRLYVVENELAKHNPLKHVAVQILEMSLSFEATQRKVKSIVKEALDAEPETRQQCENYATVNGFGNVDYLLERMIYDNEFGALVIIDELPEELEAVFMSRFKFGVEVLTLSRYRNEEGDRIYAFEPFLEDVDAPVGVVGTGTLGVGKATVDPSDIDTIVVPAREDGFQETALGENRWYKIRIHSSMIPRIKYLAVYRVAPISAITHVAPVQSIEPWKDTSKYVVNFSENIEELEKSIKLVQKGKIKAPMAPRYTSHERLRNAKNLDEAF
jgi:hypothetical protein